MDKEVKMETKERHEDQQVAGGREHDDEVLDRVLAQREKHRKRSIFARAGVVVAGGAVSVLAAPFSLVIPELGLPLLLFGLRLLALEFDRAARLYVRVEKLARRVLGGIKRLLKSKRGIAVMVVIGIVVAVAVATLVS